jgi:adenylyl-sulfate kinase
MSNIDFLSLDTSSFEDRFIIAYVNYDTWINKSKDTIKNLTPYNYTEEDKLSGVWSGWYNNRYFEGIIELSYIINIADKIPYTWKSARVNELSIPYRSGDKHCTHFADFLINDNILIDCIPKELWGVRDTLDKIRGAEKFCKEYGFAYILSSPTIIEYEKLLVMSLNGNVKFEKNIIDDVLSFNKYKVSNNKGKTVLLTGLSGSGKSTIAKTLKEKNRNLVIIDGDSARRGISWDLSLSAQDRKEHANRITKICQILNDCGLDVVVALIAPYETSRQDMKNKICNFVEVYIDCPIEKCKERDPKGLYAKHAAGEIKGMTGVDAPYEVPKSPDVTISTHEFTVDECINKLLLYISFS